jgi:hypothetical protein
MSLCRQFVHYLPQRKTFHSYHALCGASLLALTAALCSSAQQLATTASVPPSYNVTSTSYTLPYAVKVDFQHLDKTLKVHAAINGGPVEEFTVDTGSVGLIVSSEEVPNINPDAKPGQITYSSSGVQLYGVWTTATVTFPDARNANGVATAVIPVLAVTGETCTGTGVNAEHCHAQDHPHPHMLGIGFGRGLESHPEKNAFLNLTEMRNGSMTRGYIITHTGIVLGLSTKSVGDGFVWQKLKEKPVSVETSLFATGLKDWETAPGSFELKGLKAASGVVLIDTGLTNLMLASMDGPTKGDVPDGTPVIIQLLNGKLQYSFTVGKQTDPLTPRRVSWVPATHGVYVNTGLHALVAFDYLFDEDSGWLALRPLMMP